MAYIKMWASRMVFWPVQKLFEIEIILNWVWKQKLEGIALRNTLSNQSVKRHPMGNSERVSCG